MAPSHTPPRHPAPAIPQALLLDLGKVVIDIDFNRCFAFWGQRAGVDPARLAARWSADAAYAAHETGELDFDGYCAHLATILDIRLDPDDWHAGWQALFLGVYPGVARLLPRLARRYPLFAFSNTNAAHQRFWSSTYAGELAPFEHIYSSVTLGLRKPDAAAFRRVVADLGVPASRVLFVDDTPANVAGAQEAGLDARCAQGDRAVASLLAGLLA